MTQQTFFASELQSSDEPPRYLHVVKDGQVVDMRPQEIFDASRFDTLHAVTYVASARFFSNMVQEFASVTFILGIANTDVLKPFATSVKPFVEIENRLRFWNDLNDNAKAGVRMDRIILRYTVFGVPPKAIHTKLYLLSHSRTGRTRIAIGSPNFTEQAFVRQGQFEDLEIFDDDATRYAIYQARFRHIFAHTIDYIPDTCRRAPNGVVYTDAATLKQVLIEEAERFRKLVVIPQEGLQEIEALPIDLIYRKEEADRTSKVVRLLTTPARNGHHVLQPTTKLLKQSVPLQAAVSRVSKDAERNDTRPFLQYLRAEHRLLSGQRAMPDLRDFSAPAEVSSIRRTLKLIGAFVDAYRLFTVNPDPHTRSKISEILLYGFLAPFLWRIREDHVEREGRASVRASFPSFLIVAGRAFSGKTTTLEFLSVLLGHHGERYFPYGKVDTKGVLLDYFHTENVYPLLVDEVPINFFSSSDKTKGEALIKHVSNDVDGIHPVMIATTNQTEFSITGQTLRRVYYLEISDVFDRARKAEADRYLNDILVDADTALFQDFTYRFGKRIQAHDVYYAPNDFLAGARAIFKDYYREAGLELPEWFPMQIFTDYEARGRKLWRQTFTEYQSAFHENIAEDTIFVETSVFCEHPKQRRVYINYLEQGCILEDSVILVLARQKFLTFIGHEPNDIPLGLTGGARTRPSIWRKVATFFHR
jgi:hypothetical protein